jgi:hypothetical protein
MWANIAVAAFTRKSQSIATGKHAHDVGSFATGQRSCARGRQPNRVDRRMRCDPAIDLESSSFDSIAARIDVNHDAIRLNHEDNIISSASPEGLR